MTRFNKLSAQRSTQTLTSTVTPDRQNQRNKQDQRNQTLRAAIAAILAASATIVMPQKAEATCTDISTSLFCSGDEHGGIDTSDYRLGLLVYGLSQPIVPTSGVRGINFYRDDQPEQALSFFWDGTQSISSRFADTIHILNFIEPFLGARAGDITATLNGGSLFTSGGGHYDSLFVESYGQESALLLPTNGGNVTVDNRASIYNESFYGRGIYAHSWSTYSGTGGIVHVTSNAATISTQGDGGHGIFALTEGGYGANGTSSFGGSSGIPGGNGGDVLVEGSGNIYTSNFNAHGILAISRGGIGGSGGDGWVGNAGNGVFGGSAGNVTVDGSWNIYTGYDNSSGIFAESLGGEGGQGGKGYTFGNGGTGGGSGNGQTVRVTSRGNIDTGYGAYSYGIFAHSVGGFAGGGGSSYGIVGYGGSGESAGHGGDVYVTNNGTITTRGDGSHGIVAQSVGGGGGSGGSSGGIVSVGGGGAAGGNGGNVEVTNTNTISASGRIARGIFAQSVGGGGGDGGDSGGVAAIGGSGSGTSDGGTVNVINSGNISSSAHAIFAESIGGGGGNGGSSTGWFSVGGSGGSGGSSNEVSVENHGALTTTEINSSAIFAHSIGGGGGNGGASISAGLGASFAVGGNGATGGDGANVSVSSDTGSIVTGADFANGNFGHNASGIFAQSVGGSGGNGGYAFSGSVSPGASLAVALGGQGAGGGVGKVVTVTNGSSITTHGDDANAIYAESLGGGGGSGGFAIAVTGGNGLAGAFAIGGTGAGGGAGDRVTVSSSGTNLQTFGDRSSGLVAQSVGGGGGNGGFAAAGSFNLAPGAAGAFALGGNGGGGGAASTVTVDSSSNISTSGEQASGLFAQSVGGGGGNGGFAVAGSISAGAAANAAFGGNGGGGGDGGVVLVGLNAFTSGTIHTRGAGSTGLFAQSVGGGGGNGGFAVAGSISLAPSANLSVGGDGGTARDSAQVIVHTGSNVITEGSDSHGVVAQSIGGGGGSGGFSVAGGISATGAVSAGIGGHGGGGGSAGTVTVMNHATYIDTSGDHSYGLLAQSVGGGGGDGGFAVAGNISQGPSASFAMGGDGGDAGIGREVRVTSTSAITTRGNESHGLFAQSVGGGGGSGGFSAAGSVSASGGSIGASLGGSGAGGGIAGRVTVDTSGANSGAIATNGDRSTGILAQSIGGGGGNGGFAVGGNVSGGPTASLTVGGDGGTGSDSELVMVTSQSSVSTRGDDSHGIFAQSVGGGGGDGGFAVGGSISGSASVNAALGGRGNGGGNANDVRLISAGSSISTMGTHSYGISAQSLGGGGGDGGFSVAGGISGGTTANLGVGGTGDGGGFARLAQIISSTNVTTLGNDSHGVFAQSVGGGGGSGGFSVVGGISNANAGASFGGSGGGGGNGGVALVQTTGAISTSGDHAYGALAQSIGGGGGDGGFSVAGGISNGGGAALAMGGSGDGGGNGARVSLTSTSTIVTRGDDAHGLFAQSLGGGGGSGGFAVAGSLSLSSTASAGIGGSGAGGGSAEVVMLTNRAASIDTFGDRSYGVVAQSVGGGGGDGGFAVAGSITQGPAANFAMGGSGSQAGIGRDVFLNSSSAVTTRGDESHGLFAQSIGGGGGSGGFAISGSMSASGGSLGASLGGSGAGGGTAGNVTLSTVFTDSGLISTSGNHSTGILAQSVGGGGGIGGFAIGGNITNGPSASLSIGGNGGTGSDSGVVDVSSASSVVTSGNDSHGIFAQSVGGGGGDGGFAVAGSISAAGNINAALGGKGNGGGNADAVILRSNGASIATLGTHSYGIVAQSLGGGGGDGGFSVAGGISNGTTANLSMGGSGAGGGIGRAVSISSSTTVSTQGDDSHGVFAQSVGGGGGSGGFAVTGGISKANAGASIGGSGAGGGDGGIVSLRNTAISISTAGDHSYGVIAQSIGGGGGDGGFSVTGGISSNRSAAFAMGGSGSGGGNGNAVTLISSSAVTTLGNDAHGLFAQSVGGGGGSGGFAVAGGISKDGGATAAFGGSGAGGGDAEAVTLTNTGADINTFGDRSYGVVAQSVGGGGGDGGFAVSGSITKGAAANFSMGGSGDTGGIGRAVTLNSTSSVTTRGDDAHGIFAQSIGGGGGSGGFSVSGSISADSGTVGASIGGSGAGGGNSGTVSLGTTSAISGVVTTFGDRAYGILAQSVGGGGGDGGFSVAGGISKGDGAKFSMGGSGGSGSNADVVSVLSAATINTSGAESHGIFAQSIGGGGGSGGFSVAGSISTQGSSVNASIGGSGAGGGDGKAVGVTSLGASIETDGARAYGIVAQSIGGGGGDGGFSLAGSIDKQKTINFSLGGSGDVGGKSDTATVLSATNIITHGDESHGIFAQSLGGGGGSGGFSVTGSLFASTTNAPSIDASIGGSGAGGGDAGAVSVGVATNFVTGVIDTSGTGAHGIFAQSLGGGGGNGGFSVAGGLNKSPAIRFALGGSAGTGSDADKVNVYSAATIITHGDEGHGIFAQSLGGGGGNGGFSIAGSATTDTTSVNASIGGQGGGGGQGADVGVVTSGNITTLGDNSFGVFAQSVGGGGGNGGFSIAGSLTAPPSGAATKKPANNIEFSMGGDGGSGDRGGNVSVANSGDINTFGDSSHGILAHSVGGGGGSGGLSGTGTLSFIGAKSAATRATMAVSIGGDGGSGNIGGDVGVTNTRDIYTHGDDARGIYAYSVGGGGGNGGASYAIDLSLGKTKDSNGFNFELAVGGQGGTGNTSGAVAVNSSGAITTFGDHGDAILAQSIGGGGGNGGKSNAASFDFTKEAKPPSTEKGSEPWNFTTSIGGNGGTANDGGLVSVTNAGNIATSGLSARGIVAQSVGGGGGSGGNGIQGTGVDAIDTGTEILDLRDKNFVKNLFDLRSWTVTVGGSGGASGEGKDVDVTNSGSIVTRGLSSHAIFAQSIGGGGGEAQNFAKGTGNAGTAASGINSKFALGGGGGASGNGGKVTIVNSNSIATFGDEAHGIFAQSIGGGGGVAGNVDRGFSSSTTIPDVGTIPKLNIGVGIAVGQDGGGGGDGGDVTVTNTGSINTAGNGAFGILAQSIGGGGGAAGGLGNDGTFLAPVLGLQNFYGSAGGAGNAGIVTVTQTGSVNVTGGNAIGVFAQSATNAGVSNAVNITTNGDINAVGVGSFGVLAQSLGKQSTDQLQSSGNIVVTVNSGTIRGGAGIPAPGTVSLAQTDNDRGAAIDFRDGKDNVLVNRGTVGDRTELSRMAVLGEIGNETINNFGTVAGNINLGAGRNTLTNNVGASLISGAVINLSASGTLTNSGTWSVGNVASIATTTLTGNLRQTVTGRLLMDFDYVTNTADHIEVLNGGTATVAGSILLNQLRATKVKPGSHHVVLISAAGGVDATGLTLATKSTPVTTYQLAGSGTSQLALDTTTDFSLAANGVVLTPNQAAVGRYINDLQTADGSPTFEPLIARLIATDQSADIAGIYNQLTPDGYGSLTSGTLQNASQFGKALLSCKMLDGDYHFTSEGECGWFGLTVNQQTQDTTSSATGFTRDGSALAGGIQIAVSDHWHMGFGLSYDSDRIVAKHTSTSQYSNQANGNSVQGGAVVKVNYGNFTMAASITAGHGDYDATRLAVDNVFANSEQTIDSTSVQLRGAYAFDFRHWYLRPILDVDVTDVHHSAFTETGSSAYNLQVQAGTNSFVSVQPQIEAGLDMPLAAGGLARWYARIGLTSYVSGGSVDAVASLTNAPVGVAPFAVSRVLDKTLGDIALGVDLFSAEGIVIRVGYLGQYSSNSSSGGGLIKVSLPF